ncbi:MAG: CDP-glucose 4,6-dehydratase [Nitrospirae bacterium GWC2_57_13]|nr:MAG: CDP-glucose 4,6-dehydratase [Nitrospirae bacterium GWC2_57_13]HAR41205.1 CDP-glucose 4,6-dehydratase [Bdellovibrionales bacterium]
MIDRKFWQNKRVFITGHTGFKGSWLCLWMHSLGARVTGYALKPPTGPSLFDLCKIDRLVHSTIADVRDGESLIEAMRTANPDIAIHMAAQPLVRDSYKIPVETYAVNVMGTVNFFEAVRNCERVKAVINVTTDKCYENKEWLWGYRENEPLGGYDPYSSSKACSELVTSAYRSSYFNPTEYSRHGIGVASARAGNVIGGGDWATDRLIPDCVRAVLKGEKIVIRNPQAVRPWQHVLEPLSGYLLLAQKLYEDGAHFSEAWNFGPDDADAKPVEWLVDAFCKKWGKDAVYEIVKGEHPHEANYLKLDCSKAKTKLGWRPRSDLEKAVESIIEWTKAYKDGKKTSEIVFQQIKEFYG